MNVLIVEPILFVAEVLAEVLQAETDVTGVSISNSVDDALAQLEEAQEAQRDYDAALITTDLPNGDARTLTQTISANYPDTVTIVLGLVDAEPLVLHYIEAGASAYVLRNEPAQHLLEKMRAALRGEAIIEPSVAALLMERIAERSEQLSHNGIDPQVYETLTPREKEVLELVAQGYTNRQIATALTIELGTVKNHVHNVLEKLNVNSRQDAAALLSLVR